MKVVVVDDDANLRRMLRAVLEEEGYAVEEAGSAEAALEAVTEEPPEVILLDLVLPGISGLDALSRFRESVPGVPVIMISGQATLSDAVEATRRGAFHFVEKPLSPEAVILTVRGAVEVARARDLSRTLREELGPGRELVGQSPPMQRVRETIRKVAPTDARVLITGESGTGKELAAGAIHALSPRKGGPFVRVNSAALPSGLVESEMFGHEKGAFTGAVGRRRGRFELADGGTLFLDEVVELGAGAQAKLLRVLEEGRVERVGGADPVPVDVRVLAATNREPREEVASGRFREDLLFRLEVVPLDLPPLRERLQDLPALVHHAAERMRTRDGLALPPLSEGAMERLAAYPWPGNVRELFNVLERLAILHGDGVMSAEDVDRVLPGPTRRREAAAPADDVEDATTLPLRDRLHLYERTLIEGSLREASGNVAEAARRLRTDRANLYRRMRRLGISTSEE